MANESETVRELWMGSIDSYRAQCKKRSEVSTEERTIFAPRLGEERDAGHLKNSNGRN